MISKVIGIGKAALLVCSLLMLFGLNWNFPISFDWPRPVYSADPAGKANERPGRAMTSGEIAARFLNLTPNEFFGQPDFSNREFALLGEKFEGVAIGAPALVDVTKQAGLPVALAIVDTTRRQWEVYRQKNLALLALQVDSDAVHAGPAYPPPEKAPAREIFSRQPPEPRETPPYARNAKLELLQARERLDLPWQSGRFRLAVINFDRVSNLAEVELKGEGRPEEGKFQQAEPEPASQNRGQSPVLPCYEPLPESPRPSGEGLEFLIQSGKVKPSSLPITGSFVTKARKWHLDRTGTVHAGMGGKKLRSVAVVPVTLLVFGQDRNIPHRFDWAVPVYGETPVSEGRKLAGYFTIDALHGTDVRLPPGKYVAYICCDSRLHGPRPFSISSD